VLRPGVASAEARRALRWGAVGLALGVALWLRWHNATTYPADWGYDARFNWQYIFWLTRSWQLPPPDAGWSTGDPPFYYYACAAILRALGHRPVLIPLLNAALGLAVVALAVVLAQRAAPRDADRALLAGGLLLYLPAHVHMSAMVNEELLSATLTSLAVLAVARPGLLAEPRGPGLARAAAVGLAGGLAMLTKPSGALGLAAAACAYGVEAWRRRAPREAALRLALMLALAFLAGGWFYARDRWLYGWFLPFALPAHRVMFQMPPGQREWLDYVRFPLAVFTDPQLLNPDLLRSVWGSTYASVWFDAHRYFLPTASAGVRRLGGATLALALLPSAAFAAGLARGARRLWRGLPGPDAVLVPLVVLTLAAYAWFAWRNPWFVVLKGTSLLGLSLPYAFYASGSLLRWARRGRAATLAIGGLLAALAVCVVISCTFNGLFQRKEVSGLTWEAPVAR
jgi:hypothetical protein